MERLPRCPVCGSMIKLILGLSKIESNESFYKQDSVTPRAISWDCLNPDCTQRAGRPKPEFGLRKALRRITNKLKTYVSKPKT